MGCVIAVVERCATRDHTPRGKPSLTDERSRHLEQAWARTSNW